MAAMDYYGILGVPADADQPEIKRAYRAIARATHPDVMGDDAASAELFSRAQKAYGILGDSKKRAEYDRQYKPVQTVVDLFLHHPAGQEVLATRLPKGEKEQSVGVTTASVVRVIDSQDFLRVKDSTGKSTKVKLPADSQQTQWGRLIGKGSPGKNGGPAGDHLVMIRERKGRK